MGACQATLVQPRPYSSPGAPALLPARRASAAGDREARDKGVTYYSVDLGRVQRGGQDDDADRDATVITVIPGRRPHQGRCRGAGRRRAGRPGEGTPARGRRRSGCRTLGHQFQLRMARSFPLVGSLPSSRVTSSSCALPFLSVAGVSRGVRRHQFQLRTAVPSCCRGLSHVAAVTGSRRASVRFPRGFAQRSPGPVAHRVPPSRAVRR